MSKRVKKVANRSQAVVKESADCLKIFADGIHTSKDFASGMSALMGDLVKGAMPPSVGNAVCNAGGKLLKVIELQMKYGKRVGNGERVLTLSE